MIRFVALGGFLGAGKTTTLIAAAKLLEARGHRVAVITNDQGTELVDTRLARSELAAVGEVTGGCFCCRFEDLMTVTTRLLAGDGAGDGAGAAAPDTVLAEAVGSCTDLQATVLRPLRAYYGERFAPAPLTVVVDPYRHRALGSALPLHDQRSDLAYLYDHQLAEADIIAVNKTDLLTGDERDRHLEDLAERCPQATVLAYSAATGDGLTDLLAAWDRVPPAGPGVDIDYDRYAAAEAQLAWFNQTYTLTGGGPGFSPEQWARTALRHISQAAAGRGWAVGHVKVSVETPAGLTKAGCTAAGQAPTVDVSAAGRARTAVAHLNARIACSPESMDATAAAAVTAADAQAGATSVPATGGGVAFRPSYPRPVHRITGAGA